jgi:hypothetical protein
VFFLSSNFLGYALYPLFGGRSLIFGVTCRAIFQCFCASWVCLCYPVFHVFNVTQCVALLRISYASSRDVSGESSSFLTLHVTTPCVPDQKLCHAISYGYTLFGKSPLRSRGQSSWPHNVDVLRFLWGTNWIYICYVEESRPPLWSSGQSSWLHTVNVLWGTNWIYMCYVEESRPPLWSSGQSSWLHNGDVLWFLCGTNWIYMFF